MDFQKEKEAFEKHASKFFITNEAFEDDGENYVYDEVKFMWDCWLAAKAQAVPEGYAVVPVEPKQETIKQMNKVWFESNCAHIMKTKIAELLYKAMLEAQEPAND